MRVFVIGMSGGVGSLLVTQLHGLGVQAAGLVRQRSQQLEAQAREIDATVGDIATLSVEELATMLAGSDAVVYAAGSNGGARRVTTTVDGNGVSLALEAARRAGVAKFVLVSVLPEAWRERALGDDVEYYFAVKKRAEVEVVRSPLEWVVVRPSLLVDDPGTGMVSLGPVEIHDQVSRADVAGTIVETLLEPRIRRQVLELNRGATPIAEAVAAAVRAG